MIHVVINETTRVVHTSENYTARTLTEKRITRLAQIAAVRHPFFVKHGLVILRIPSRRGAATNLLVDLGDLVLESKEKFREGLHVAVHDDIDGLQLGFTNKLLKRVLDIFAKLLSETPEMHQNNILEIGVVQLRGIGDALRRKLALRGRLSKVRNRTKLRGILDILSKLGNFGVDVGAVDGERTVDPAI